MIELTNGYFVKVTAHSYNVIYDTGKWVRKLNTKTGEETREKVLEPVTYHATMADAIRGAMKDMQRRKLADLNGTLADAVKEIKAVHEEFNELLKNVVGEAE